MVASNKSILFCGNGMSAEAIKPVKELGYTVYLITDYLNDRGVDDADKVVHAVTKNPADALRAARDLAAMGCKFNGVISLCWDCAPSVTAVAEEFGLWSLSKKSAEAATIKSIRSIKFKEHGIAAPRFELVTSLQEARKTAEHFGFPVVIKPIDLSSCKGVILVENMRQLENSFKYTAAFSKSKQILVNEYLRGTEHSTEGLMIKGKLHPTGLSDRIFKYTEFKPHFIEVGDIMPTILSAEIELKMFHLTEKAALALGITNGVVKGDMVHCDDGRVMILELAGRLGGPRFGTEMIPLSNGTNILKAAIQMAVGDPIDLECLNPKFRKGMVNRTIFPKPGKVIAITGLDKIKSMQGYYDFKWWTAEPLKIGDEVSHIENGCGSAGYIIATGETREEAINNADKIEAVVKIATA